MTRSLQDFVLTRPEAATPPGPDDGRFYDLVEDRFRRLIRDNPVAGTYLGIHTEDHRLGDASRDALLGELAGERAHLVAVEAIDPIGLSTDARFERDLEIHNVRRAIFDIDVVRTWERRSTALDVIGDALFLVFAQDFAPLPERLGFIASRLEAVPTYLADSASRATVPQVRAWQQLEIESAADLPSFFAEIVAAGAGLPDADRRRLERAADGARAAIADYARGLTASLATGADDWALGPERYDALVELRGFDGLDADAILEIGEDQLEMHKAARIRAAREVDDRVDEATLIDRLSGRFSCGQCGASYHERYHRPRIEGICDICGGTSFMCRADDRPEALATRFEAYRNQTAPILPYYRDRGILRSVDGMADIDQVSRQIEAVLRNGASR